MFDYFSEKKYDQIVKDYINQQTAYHFIEMIGLGSYGVAYLIEDAVTREKFVLKRMKAKHIRKEKLRNKFFQEINMLKDIDFFNVPSVLFHGEIQKLPYYIMEYVDGQTFEQVIFKNGMRFSIEQSLQITKKLLEIVIKFHKKGIVHRDLRIPNILLKDNQIYIIDFGLATYMKEDVNLKEINNPKRAENYISDLYFIGHFLLFLLYSTYTPMKKKERSWQEELELPPQVTEYIERLLLIRSPFSSTEDALVSIPLIAQLQS
ncbi:serine/threonine protein kinase [Ureibacillus sp. 179-F W5.1 NHS]|uniref:Serine/threonine protein kinase n=1 Tax=Lysinibacillus halotolerans TaxID=1368476 RepID=A0A3M8H975_9BACI|nr:protein kinase [Lysinibacillus halotolerans]RNC98987.1 serine/threonine protein kinase [Lysinibacillus halotolerans]